MKKEIDLKLLKLIHTVVTTGTVTETARTLQQSPGNISYMLGKARKLTGAHLFIRTREGMRPDATALELSQRYQQYMESDSLSRNMSGENSRDSLSINTYSLIEMMLAVNVCESGDSAQPISYIFNSYVSESNERIRRLKNKEIDIDIGNKLPVETAVSAIKLFTSGVSVLLSESRSKQLDSFGMQELCASRHAIWSALPDYYSGSIGGALSTSAFLQARDVAVVSGSMINMVSLCANSACVMLIPDVFAPMLEKNFPVKCFRTPDELDIRYDCYLHYRTELEKEPRALECIQAFVASMVGQLPGAGTWH